MSHGFPKNSPVFSGVLRPSRIESDIADLEVEGQLPPELEGALYRAGPDNRFVPMLGDDTIVHGDGMITKLQIKNGRASFSSRYVRTERFLAEEKAGRSLFGEYRNPWSDDPSVAGMDRGTANTNVVFHAGRLLALKEDAQPIEIDPHSLATIGKWNAEGTITPPFVTAHPHPDARTGELLMFSSQAKGLGTSDLVFLPVNAEGRVPKQTWLKAPYPCLMHDWFATQRHALFPITPAIVFPERVKEGAPYYMWDKTQPSYIGVLPRDGSGEVRWFQGPPRFAMHFINAWEENGQITLQATMASPDQPPFFPPADLIEPPKEWAPGTVQIVNWVLDLNSSNDQIQEVRLIDDGDFIEFPRVDPRVETTRHRYVWWARKDFDRPSVPHPLPIVAFNGIERRDELTGERDTYWTDDQWAFGEPVFVPRQADSAEGDGFVIAPVYRIEGQGNAYMVFDAMNIAQGPLATVHVPFHFRPGFHGNWVTADELEAAANSARS